VNKAQSSEAMMGDRGAPPARGVSKVAAAFMRDETTSSLVIHGVAGQPGERVLERPAARAERKVVSAGEGEGVTVHSGLQCAHSPQWMVHPVVLNVVTLLRHDKARAAPD
jgi:hypothetical protein